MINTQFGATLRHMMPALFHVRDDHRQAAQIGAACILTQSELRRLVAQMVD